MLNHSICINKHRNITRPEILIIETLSYGILNDEKFKQYSYAIFAFTSKCKAMDIALEPLAHFQIP